jgi:hypothetical protein
MTIQIGDVLAYWGGSGDELSMLTVIGFGFVELPALLLLVLAMVVYGVGLARERIKPPVVAWSLIAGGTPRFQCRYTWSRTSRTGSCSRYWRR